MKLLQGDCLELMREIPDGSVDMVLCDLPYGTTQNRWDTCIPFQPLWDHWHRVCKPNAAILLFGQMPFTAALVMSNPREFRYEWIYEKTNATGFLNANKMPLKCHESVSVFYKELPTFNPQMENGSPYTKGDSPDCETYRRGIKRTGKREYNGVRYPRDVLKIANSGYGTNRGYHPTQKPVPLLEYLIKTYTKPGETVLDNCMGSGSTGVACANTGRDFIGIELDPGYFRTAQKRIEDAQAQMRLEAVM